MLHYKTKVAIDVAISFKIQKLTFKLPIIYSSKSIRCGYIRNILSRIQHNIFCPIQHIMMLSWTQDIFDCAWI